MVFSFNQISGKSCVLSVYRSLASYNVRLRSRKLKEQYNFTSASTQRESWRPTLDGILFQSINLAERNKIGETFWRRGGGGSGKQKEIERHWWIHNGIISSLLWYFLWWLDGKIRALLPDRLFEKRVFYYAHPKEQWSEWFKGFHIHWFGGEYLKNNKPGVS